MSLVNTAIYAGINISISAILGIMVVRMRRKTRTSVGDGGEKAMLKALRAHGNNVENVPLALVVIGLLEALGAHVYFIHFLGVCLTVGRLLHARGMYQTLGPSTPRILGMVLTWLVLWIGAPACIYFGILGH